MKHTVLDKCSTISVFRYYKALLYNDFRFLIQEFDYDKPLPGFDVYKSSKELSKVATALSEEYAVLVSDKKTLKLEKDRYTLIFLSERLNLIGKVLKLYADSGTVEVLDILPDLKIPFDITKPIKPQIDAAIRSTKLLKNKINIKRLAFEKLSGVNQDEKKKESVPDDIMISLDKKALSLELNLALGYRVDIHNTSIERWVNLTSMETEKARALEK